MSQDRSNPTPQQTPTYRAEIRNTTHIAPYADGHTLATFEDFSLALLIAQVETWMYRNVVDGGNRPEVLWTEDGEEIPSAELADVGADVSLDDFAAIGTDESEARAILGIPTPDGPREMYSCTRCGRTTDVAAGGVAPAWVLCDDCGKDADAAGISHERRGAWAMCRMGVACEPQERIVKLRVQARSNYTQRAEQDITAWECSVPTQVDVAIGLDTAHSEAVDRMGCSGMGAGARLLATVQSGEEQVDECDEEELNGLYHTLVAALPLGSVRKLRRFIAEARAETVWDGNNRIHLEPRSSIELLASFRVLQRAAKQA